LLDVKYFSSLFSAESDPRAHRLLTPPLFLLVSKEEGVVFGEIERKSVEM
jgi:hypothetical protein